MATQERRELATPSALPTVLRALLAGTQTEYLPANCRRHYRFDWDCRACKNKLYRACRAPGTLYGILASTFHEQIRKRVPALVDVLVQGQQFVLVAPPTDGNFYHRIYSETLSEVSSEMAPAAAKVVVDALFSKPLGAVGTPPFLPQCCMMQQHEERWRYTLPFIYKPQRMIKHDDHLVVLETRQLLPGDIALLRRDCTLNLYIDSRGVCTKSNLMLSDGTLLEHYHGDNNTCIKTYNGQNWHDMGTEQAVIEFRDRVEVILREINASSLVSDRPRGLPSTDELWARAVPVQPPDWSADVQAPVPTTNTMEVAPWRT